MKLLSLGILALVITASFSTAANAAICDLNFDGCKTGAASIVSNGKALSSCQWLKDLSTTLDALNTVGSCSTVPKSCEVKSSGCKAGAAWIAYEGKALTPCEWMPEFQSSFRTAYLAGICSRNSLACEYKTSSSCKTGAGQIYIGSEMITACEWLADASQTIKSLRRSGACR